MTKKKLIYFVTEDWYFLSHRLPMARAGMAAGFDVAVIANVGSKREAIEAAGVRVIPFALQRRSLNPFTALRQVWALRRIYKNEKPDLAHHIALKPVLFGSLAAWLAGVPRVLNAFAGLGVIFETDIRLARVLRPALTAAFYLLLRRPGYWTLFQNDDDRTKLIDLGICDVDRAVVIRGSGVDVARYPLLPFPPTPPFICVMAGRMIDAKGLSVLQAAFEAIRDLAPHIKLWLCGQPDPANPGSWDEARLRAWCDDNPNVTWMGQQSDMALIWPRGHVALQPSLGGEGLPKSLLEAGACARAMIATDVPGCREVVQQGRNGFLIPKDDSRALYGAILYMADHLKDCAAMGLESRKIVEADLSAEAVSEQTEELYRRIVFHT